MLDGLISALRFLTVIPLPFKRNAVFKPKESVAFFPLAGLLIGLIVALLDMLFCWCFNPITASAMDVAVLVGLTGALHIDGLADSADGLFSHKPAKKMLEIMRDSRTGSMGVAAVAVVLLLKFAGFAGLGPNRFALILIIPAFARMGLVFAMTHLPYLRKEDGLAGPFFVDTPPPFFWVFLAMLLVAAGLLGLQGIAVIAGFIASTLIIMLFYSKRAGGVTGDMLGAMIEVQEAVLLVLACLG